MDGIEKAVIFVTLLSSVLETCFGCNARDSFPVVNTPIGDIRGKQLNIKGNHVSAFLGIPYAEPPVGDQRFKKSVPKRSWLGVYEATKKPPPCMQYSKEDYPWIPKDTPSEDCLYLNVWAPGKMNSFKEKSRRKPVLLFIYGGGFVSGSSSLEQYDGAILAAEGKVVVVSMNYRTGVFGFLTSGKDESPGNMGLHDQYLAMEWVKNNIRNFNGDPDKITLFGQSAGAVAVALHSISPLSRNLFRRGILQSGGSYHPLLVPPSSFMVNVSNLFATAAGCANDTVNMFTENEKVVECLRKMDALQLAMAEGFFSLPTYGDDFMPVNPITAMNNGDFKRTEFLVGTNKDEGSILLHLFSPDIFGSQHVSRLDKKQAESVITNLFQDSTNPSPQVISDFYLSQVSDSDASAIIKAVYDSYGDNIISCPAVFSAEKFAKEADVFYYYFTHRPSNTIWGKWMGVAHLDEIPFVFGDPVRNPSNYTEEEVIFSRTVMQRWIAFAKTGVPTVLKNERWPKFTESRPTYLELNPKRRRIGETPHKGCDFWRSYFGTN